MACNGIKYQPTKNAKKYMIDIMLYPELETALLQKIFRHSLVHLAQPKPIIKHKTKKYTWRYHHNKRSEHLLLNSVSSDENLFEFNISICSLVEDITESVFKPNGYLHKLETDKTLQENFKKVCKNELSITFS